MGEVIRSGSGTEQMEGADGGEVEAHLKTAQVNTVSMSDVALSCQALSLDGHDDAAENGGDAQKRLVSVDFEIFGKVQVLLHERLGSLQRGMEQFQLTLDRVERRLDEQVEVFDTLRADLEHLEDKVKAVRSANNTKRPNHVAESVKRDNVTSSSRPTRVQPER